MRPGLPVPGLQGNIRTEVSLTQGTSAVHVCKPRETTSICTRVAYYHWATGMELYKAWDTKERRLSNKIMGDTKISQMQPPTHC